ncbi:hypothetical protein [Streptomyces endophytica]|uniref:hypothetical protein n=1 Tax=Streptomyces endophytica TaxID=2991496 RepID=UPI003C6FC888
MTFTARPGEPVLITHDLQPAPDADRILVLDRGRLLESGRHAELLARAGTYARPHRSTTGQPAPVGGGQVSDRYIRSVSCVTNPIRS